MKVSLNWAQYYSNVDLKSLPTDELVKLATERLGGIEGVTDLSKHYEGIVVAKVVSCVKHPNADKLSLCKVDDAGVVKDVARDENGYVQVVCGAPNVREGLLVAWIPPSAIVPSSYGEKELFVLEARDLRGELSSGMLASPAELGVSDDHSGILEIDEKVKVGTPFKELYGLDDVILEIENKMFTHRPDGFGQLGVARELAGIQGLAFESPDWYLAPSELNEDRVANREQSSVSDPQSPILNVTIESSDLCPRYMAVVIDDVNIKPSPVWLQSYLKRVGLKPINNVVDITNYMMMLTAQPLHAFDFDKVAKEGRVDVTVRRPKDGEKMTLLDGKEIQPHKDATLICSKEGPIALGGVMGGGNSEIDETTKKVVLECATFDMYNIRKTSMIHGIFTDAVTRFNKGQPAEQLPAVLAKAVRMFEQLADGQAVDEVVDNYHEPKVSQTLTLSVDFINSRLGSDLSSEQIVTLLTNVEFRVELSAAVVTDIDRESSKDMDPLKRSEDDRLVVTAPFWRTDIEIAEDIVEEVGRLYGFNRLPLELPKRSIKPVRPDGRLQLKQRIRGILARAGANELLTYSFVHGNLLERVGQKSENSYKIRNALSPDLQYYRQTLTPSLLEKVHPNIKSGFEEFAIFEINKTHNKVSSDDQDGLPTELNMVALTFASNKQDKSSAFFATRKYLDYLAASLGLTLSYSSIKDEPGYPVTAPFDYSRSALVTIKEVDVFLGIIGEYKQEVVNNLKLPVRSAGFEVGLDHLLEALDHKKEQSYVPLSRYPSTDRDITFRLVDSVDYETLHSLVVGSLQETDFRWDVQPKSIYRKEGEDTRNITLGIKLSHNERTLTTNEVNKLVDQITWLAHEQLNAEQV